MLSRRNVINAGNPSRECLDDEQVKGLEEARDLLIGDEEDISPDKATWNGTQYVGGIAWERSRFAASLEDTSRTYTLAQSYQVQRNTTGPCIGAKVIGQPSPHQQLRHTIIKVSFSTM